MIKLSSIITLVLFSFYALSQEEEKKPVRIDGKIVDINQHPVSFAHIINKERNIGTASDYYGNFSIGSYPGDTLTITAISFHNLRIVLPDTITEIKYNLLLVMKPDTIMLQEQVIYPWPETYEEFQKEFLNIEPEEEEEEAMNRPWFLPGELTNLAYPEGGIRITGPISLLFNRFSKEAKTRIALRNIRLQEKVAIRYNAELITRITGITDGQEISEIIKYCDLKPDFISSSSDYELYMAIYQCYKEYIILDKD
jgi:hypothetical protein